MEQSLRTEIKAGIVPFPALSGKNYVDSCKQTYRQWGYCMN